MASYSQAILDFLGLLQAQQQPPPLPVSDVFNSRVVLSQSVPSPILTPQSVVPQPPEPGFIAERDIQLAWDVVEKGASAVCSGFSYRRDRPLVVIDLGHSHDPYGYGAKSPNGQREAYLIDPIGAAVGTRLRAEGFDVVFTREPEAAFPYPRSAENIGPQKINSNQLRAEFALQLVKITGHSSVQFLSLHADSRPGWTSERGGTFFAGSMENHDKKSDFGRAALDPSSVAFGGSIAANYRIAPNIPTSRKTADFDVISYFDQRKLALKVNGVAGLLETGYLTNRDDEAILLNDPQGLGTQIANGVIAWNAPQPMEILGTSELQNAADEEASPGVVTM